MFRHARCKMLDTVQSFRFTNDKEDTEIYVFFTCIPINMIAALEEKAKASCFYRSI